MNRREFVKGLVTTIATLTLGEKLVPPVLARGLEERILWEEAQRRVRISSDTNLSPSANYAPPKHGRPSLFVSTIGAQQGFLAYPTPQGSILLPLEAHLFTMLPPGYEGKPVKNSFFPVGNMNVLPLEKYVTLDGITFPLQPMPNPFRDWDGVFVREGTCKGEKYLFVAGRSSFPLFTIEKKEKAVEISFLDFYISEFRGVMGVYRNGVLDSEMSNIYYVDELPENIRVESLMSVERRDEYFGCTYPLHADEGGVHLIRVRIPLARKDEKITFTYSSSGGVFFPEKEEELKDIPPFPFVSGWLALPSIPLRLTIFPNALKEKTRITPRTTPYAFPTFPANEEEVFSALLDIVLEEYNLKPKPGMRSYTVAAYPTIAHAPGVSVSAIPPSPRQEGV